MFPALYRTKQHWNKYVLPVKNPSLPDSVCVLQVQLCHWPRVDPAPHLSPGRTLQEVLLVWGCVGRPYLRATAEPYMLRPLLPQLGSAQLQHFMLYSVVSDSSLSICMTVQLGHGISYFSLHSEKAANLEIIKSSHFLFIFSFLIISHSPLIASTCVCIILLIPCP